MCTAGDAKQSVDALQASPSSGNRQAAPLCIDPERGIGSAQPLNEARPDGLSAWRKRQECAHKYTGIEQLFQRDISSIEAVEESADRVIE